MRDKRRQKPFDRLGTAQGFCGGYLVKKLMDDI